MQEHEKLIKSLHPFERKILPLLRKFSTIEELEAHSKLKQVEIVRALQWLENKNLVKIEKFPKDIVLLDKNGILYLEKKLPERRLLEAVAKKQISFDEAKKILDKDEFTIALGLLKNKNLIKIENGKISITEQGKQYLDKEFLEEMLLKKLSQGGSLFVDSLLPEERYALEQLRKRKQIVKIEKFVERRAYLSDLGKKIANQDLKLDLIESLTPSIIKKGLWKEKEFRRYDIKINVPKRYAAREHIIHEVIKYIKKIWLELGFKEMQGSLIQPAFWNFDALFVPQDHPARDAQDTFFIPGKASLPKEIVKHVEQTHENGWTTKSKGWKYFWNLEEARKLVLRTHTTVLSARTLAGLTKKDLPAKFFAVGKNFRNETVDWSHLFELIQVEGIVVDENVNLRHLIGYLKEFFRKMGYEKIRVRPGYFPYTEPSCEVDVFHPEKKQWMELGGAGIFRPEVTKPLLGFECPVLAWGLGLERTIMEYYGIKDIRDIYKNNLSQLNEFKSWIKYPS